METSEERGVGAELRESDGVRRNSSLGEVICEDLLGGGEGREGREKGGIGGRAEEFGESGGGRGGEGERGEGVRSGVVVGGWVF